MTFVLYDDYVTIMNHRGALLAALVKLRIEAISAQAYLPNQQAMDMMEAAIEQASDAIMLAYGGKEASDANDHSW